MSYSNELYHYGIRGMHWGVRRYQNYDGTLTGDGRKKYNLPDNKYKETQQRQDSSMYGKGGVRRIAKQVGGGNTILGARSLEATRISNARSSATAMMRGGRIVGSVLGAVGGIAATKYIDQKYSRESGIVGDILRDPATKLALSAVIIGGAQRTGTDIGSELGKSVGMLRSGYSPNLYRYV